MFDDKRRVRKKSKQVHAADAKRANMIFTQSLSVVISKSTSTMNELPAVGYPSCAKNSGIVRGQTLQVVRRKCKAKSCLDVHNIIFGRVQRLFAVVLLQMDLGNIDAWKI